MTSNDPPLLLVGDTAHEIVARVEHALISGVIAPGDRLPTVRGLAQMAQVSPSTVASAYRTLRLRGLIVTRGRGGTTVSTMPPVAPSHSAPPVPPGVRDLSSGNPDPDLIPSLSLPPGGMASRPALLYCEDQNVAELVKAAEQSFDADGVKAANIVVVSGALDGVERVLQSRLRPGDRVGVEDPGYAGLVHLVAAMGLQVVPMGMDENGPLPADVEEALRGGAKAICITPRAHNPVGAALSADRARAISRLLESRPEVLIVVDDHGFDVADEPYFDVIPTGHGCWSVIRSVTKSLGPDLRLGFITSDEVTHGRVLGRQQLGAGWVSHILQGLVANMLADPRTVDQVNRAKRVYAERRIAAYEALRARGIAATGRSGYNLWIPVSDERGVVNRLLLSGWAVAAGEAHRLRSPPAVRVTTSTLLSDEARSFASDFVEAVGETDDRAFSS